MGAVDTASSSPPSYTKRLSGVPAEFVKQHFVGSPTGMKSFADSVDGAKPEIFPVKCDVVLKGFCLSASLLPSLRAGYKVCLAGFLLFSFLFSFFLLLSFFLFISCLLFSFVFVSYLFISFFFLFSFHLFSFPCFLPFFLPSFPSSHSFLFF